MARGRPKKHQPIVTPPNPTNTVKSIDPPLLTPSKEEVMPNAQEEKKEKENGVLSSQLPPLEPTQQYFESPGGEILVGEKSATRHWCRKENLWINPKR